MAEGTNSHSRQTPSPERQLCAGLDEQSRRSARPENEYVLAGFRLHGGIATAFFGGAIIGEHLVDPAHRYSIMPL